MSGDNAMKHSNAYNAMMDQINGVGRKIETEAMTNAVEAYNNLIKNGPKPEVATHYLKAMEALATDMTNDQESYKTETNGGKYRRTRRTRRTRRHRKAKRPRKTRM